MRFAKVLTVVLVLTVAAAPAFAGVGIHVNYDMTTIDPATESFKFEDDPANYGTSTLTRTESTNPVGLGIDLTFGMLPIIDLAVSVDAAVATYDFVFTPAAAAQTAGAEVVTQEDMVYLRAGGDVSALITVLSLPPVASVAKLQVGGGLSAGVMTPIASRSVLLENVSSATADVAPEDYISSEMVFGFHGIAAVTVKPPAIPLGIRAFAKYYMMSGVEDPQPDSWITVGAGIMFGF